LVPEFTTIGGDPSMVAGYRTPHFSDDLPYERLAFYRDRDRMGYASCAIGDWRRLAAVYVYR